MDVTRGEYNRIIDTLNERAIMLNEFRNAINALQQASEVQFKRIAQIQAQVDRLNRAWSRAKMSQ
jgi:archaellum component FlaC